MLVLERTTACDDVVSTLSKISGTVKHCLDKFISELSTTSAQHVAPLQPSLHTLLVWYTRPGLHSPGYCGPAHLDRSNKLV